jgi:hypothetical protein
MAARLGGEPGGQRRLNAEHVQPEHVRVAISHTASRRWTLVGFPRHATTLQRISGSGETEVCNVDS